MEVSEKTKRAAAIKPYAHFDKVKNFRERPKKWPVAAVGLVLARGGRWVGSDMFSLFSPFLFS